MKKRHDWAEEKARKVLAQWNYRRGAFIDNVSSALRAERKRAIRLCWQAKVNLTARILTFDELKIHQQACSDCISMIAKKRRQ